MIKICFSGKFKKIKKNHILSSRISSFKNLVTQNEPFKSMGRYSQIIRSSSNIFEHFFLFNDNAYAWLIINFYVLICFGIFFRVKCQHNFFPKIMLAYSKVYRLERNIMVNIIKSINVKKNASFI